MGLALDEPNEDDSKISLNGIELLAEKSLNPYLKDKIIDYVNLGYENGFKISAEHESC